MANPIEEAPIDLSNYDVIVYIHIKTIYQHILFVSVDLSAFTATNTYQYVLVLSKQSDTEARPTCTTQAAQG